MRPVPIKAYASLFPADGAALRAVADALAGWHITDAAELAGDLLRISHEGEIFPADDVIDALLPFLSAQSEGRLDVIDLENWTLRRVSFTHGKVETRTASLDHALEPRSW
jgi:hypothetical protein